MFDAKSYSVELIEWIRKYFENNGSKNTKAIIGISGGVDSTVVATLLVEALGRDRVIPVQLPQGVQTDFDDASEVIDYLELRENLVLINIKEILKPTYDLLNLYLADQLNDVVVFNTPARIRMMMLYAIAGQLGGRVANTCNLSESTVGYDTKWGDNAGDFAPIQDFTKTEVREIGRAFGLPEKFIIKTPVDGLCGQSDEERFGFTYDELDRFLRGDMGISCQTATRIGMMRDASEHKRNPIPKYNY